MAISTANITQPLDLQRILVNHFAGGMDIFFFIALVFFGYLAAVYRMPNKIFLMLMVLFVVLLAGFGYTILYTIAIFAAGMIIYWTLSKVIKS